MENQEKPLFFCSACLIPIDEDALIKRIQRQVVNADQCEDCRDFGKPMRNSQTWNHPVLGKINCKPHTGDVDDDFNPLNKAGRLYMPGERICGLKDCVRRSHVARTIRGKQPKLIADPVETILALAEMQNYKRKNPARQQRESSGVTEMGESVI